MNRDIFMQIINGMQPDQHQFALLHRVIVFPSRATLHEDRLHVMAFIRHEIPAVYYTSILVDLPHQDTLMAVRAGRPDVNGIPLREESDASVYLSVYGSFSYLANFGTATPMLNTRLSVVANHVHVDATLPDVSPELRQLARTTMEGSQFQRPAAPAQAEQEDPNQVPGQTTTTFNFATTEEREEQQRQARIRHEEVREAMEVEEEMQENDQEESGRDKTSDVKQEAEQDAPVRQQAAETSARYMQERLAIKEENAEEGNEIIEDETQVDVQEEEEPTQPTQPQQPSPPPQQSPQQPQQPPQLHQPESRRTGVITRQQLQQGKFQARAETLLNEVAQGLQRLTRSTTRARAREERAERTAKRRKRE